MTIQFHTSGQATGSTQRLLRNADVDGLLRVDTFPAVDGFRMRITRSTERAAEAAAEVLLTAGYEILSSAPAGAAHGVTVFAQEVDPQG